jgi:hypothetical protein
METYVKSQDNSSAPTPVPRASTHGTIPAIPWRIELAICIAMVASAVAYAGRTLGPVGWLVACGCFAATRIYSIISVRHAQKIARLKRVAQ